MIHTSVDRLAVDNDILSLFRHNCDNLALLHHTIKINYLHSYDACCCGDVTLTLVSRQGMQAVVTCLRVSFETVLFLAMLNSFQHELIERNKKSRDVGKTKCGEKSRSGFESR